MSAINVNSITGRTGSHGPVLTGVTTITGKLNADSGVSVTGVVTATSFDGTFSGSTITGVSTAGITSAYLNTINDLTYPTTGPLSNRNLIINGAMTVMQRTDTSTAITADGYYVQDRMHMFFNCDGGANLESSTDVPAGAGFSKSLKWDVTSSDTSIAADQYAAIDYRIEGQDHAQLCYGTAQAKTTAISFWAKSTLTGPFCYSIRNDGASRAFIREFSLTAANTWERITLTIPGDTSGTWLTDKNVGAYHQISLSSGSSFQSTAGSWHTSNVVATTNQVNLMADAANDFYLTGWQVEAGERSTPFEHRPAATELALCQRYYQRLLVNGFVANCSSTGGTTAYFSLPCSVPFRVTPTLDKGDALAVSDGPGSTEDNLNINQITYGTQGNAVRLRFSRIGSSGTFKQTRGIYNSTTASRGDNGYFTAEL